MELMLPEKCVEVRIDIVHYGWRNLIRSGLVKAYSPLEENFRRTVEDAVLLASISEIVPAVMLHQLEASIAVLENDPHDLLPSELCHTRRMSRGA